MTDTTEVTTVTPPVPAVPPMPRLDQPQQAGLIVAAVSVRVGQAARAAIHAAGITPADFVGIDRQIMELVLAQSEFNYMMLHGQLGQQARNRLELIARVRRDDPTHDEIEQWIGYIVRRRAVRGIQQSLRRVMESLRDDADPGALAAQIIGGVTAATRSSAGGRAMDSVADITDSVMQIAEQRRATPGEVHGVPTGIPALDRETGGFGLNDLHVIAGRPGMGKSSLLCQMVVAAGRKARTDGGTVVFFSLEMPPAEIVSRMACQIADVDSTALRNGTLGDDDYARFKAALAEISGLPIVISRTGGHSVRMMRAITAGYETASDGTGVVAVFIDTLNRIALDGPTSGLTPYAVVSRIADALADWARAKTAYPVVCTAQLSRENERRSDKGPTLSDLRDSGVIEQNAATVMMLHRPGYYARDGNGVAQLMILKSRYGSADADIELRWFPHCQAFRPAATDDGQPVEMRHRPRATASVTRVTAPPRAGANGGVSAVVSIAPPSSRAGRRKAGTARPAPSSVGVTHAAMSAPDEPGMDAPGESGEKENRNGSG